MTRDGFPGEDLTMLNRPRPSLPDPRRRSPIVLLMVAVALVAVVWA